MDIKTKRLHIRRFIPDDWQAVYHYTSNPTVMEYIPEGVFTEDDAKAFIKVQDDFGTFDNYIWDFVEGRRTKHNFFKYCSQIPTTTTESINFSKDLKARGFSFVGPTICYALMQAIGLINDHTTNCFRHKELIENEIR